MAADRVEPLSQATTLTWNNANAAAQLAGGYLATLTSQAESDFVHALIDAPRYWNPTYLFWLPDPVTNLHGPYLGGSKPAGSAGPGVGFEWHHGDGLLADTFENWGPGEPNNAAGDQSLLWYLVPGVDANPPARVNQWDDFQPYYSASVSYVIECDAMPVPEPEQWGALIGLGLGGWAILRRRFGPRKGDVRPG